MVHFLWSKLWDLPWWAAGLILIYLLYFVIRSAFIYFKVKEEGLIDGFKEVILDDETEYVRLYHILRVIIDIPPLILGLFFPILNLIFTMKIKKIKKPDRAIDSHDVYHTSPRD